MSAEETLYSALSSWGGLTALVSTRIHANVRDEAESLPSVVFLRVGTQPINSIHGTTLANIVTLGVVCFGETRATTEAVAEQVLLAGGTSFHPQDRRSDYSEETQLHSTTITFLYHDT